MPGTHSLTDKAALASSLEAAYGPAAWGLLPRTFRLPHQFGQLAVHLKQVGCVGVESLLVVGSFVCLVPCHLLKSVGGTACASGWHGPLASLALPASTPHELHPLTLVHHPPLLQEQQAGQGSLWVLKEDVHRGKGVAVASPARTLLRALEASPRRGGGTRHVMAQRFMTDQMLVGDRPFYIRWVGKG